MFSPPQINSLPLIVDRISEMEAHQIFAFISSSLSILLNFLLLPVIYFFSSKYIGDYKYFLLLYTSTCILYSGTYLLTLPVSFEVKLISFKTFHYSELGIILYGSVYFINRSCGTIGVVAFAFCYGMFCIVICICFAYRYVINCNYSNLKWFKSSPHIFVTIGFVLLAFTWLIFTVLAETPNEEIDVMYEVEAQTYFNRSVYNISYIGGALKINGHLYMKLIVAISSYFLLVIIVFSIIGWCAYRIYSEVNSALGSSSVKRIYQKKLFLLLLFQTFSPLLFDFLPVIVILGAFYLQLETGSYDRICGSLLTFAQVLDPIIVCLSLKDFRQGIFHLFYRKRAVIKDVVSVRFQTPSDSGATAVNPRS